MPLPAAPCTITMSDPADADANSGGPARVIQELRRDHPSLQSVWPGPISLLPRWASLIPARWRYRAFHFDGLPKQLEHAFHSLSRQAVLARARRLASATQSNLSRLPVAPDVLIGCFVCWPLFELSPSVPMVYYTDGTSRQINETYYYFRSRSKGFLEACIKIEREVLGRARLIGVAAEAARRSCVDDYGIDPSRVRVIPMGANVMPDVPLVSAQEVSIPTKDDLRLVLVASDIRRKRTDFAVEVAERLRGLGWNATLVLIGTPSVRAAASPAVRCLGALKLSSPGDRMTHQRALSEAHLMILPSEAECFGIAPAEAAHFGRPSIVSAAGGLPTVVLHDQTGLVMPPAASAEDYTRAIIELASDPARYRAMAQAALERAKGTLHWQAWRRGMQQLIRDAVAEAPART